MLGGSPLLVPISGMHCESVLLAQQVFPSVVGTQIIPIEGDFLYNDEKQASFQGILPEMVITR